MIFPSVKLPHTQTRELTSTLNGNAYRLYIGLPPDYDSSDERYPVLMVLDANWFFPIVTGIARQYQLGELMPKVLIVGVGYPSEDTQDIFVRRMRDYTPTNNPNYPTSGGGAEFRHFIQDELLPLLDNDYRTKPGRRTILGASASGIYVMYQLFRDHTPFLNYIAVSPSLFWDDAVLFNDEENHAAVSMVLPVRVFLSAGSLEGDGVLPLVEQMAMVLHNRGYEGLQLRTAIMDDETHFSTLPGAFGKALRWVYE